jgi:1-deoxy-D-xylulose-5-phosphate synthase
MEWAVDYDGPVAIKYSRGDAYYGLKDFNTPIECGKSEIIHRGTDVAVIAVGNMVQEAEKLYNRFKNEGRDITFVNARFVKPVDTDMVDDIAASHKLIVIMEEGIRHGGYGSMVEEYIADRAYKIRVLNVAIDDTFVKHGSVEELRKMLKLDADSVYEAVCRLKN